MTSAPDAARSGRGLCATTASHGAYRWKIGRGVAEADLRDAALLEAGRDPGNAPVVAGQAVTLSPSITCLTQRVRRPLSGPQEKRRLSPGRVARTLNDRTTSGAYVYGTNDEQLRCVDNGIGQKAS